MWEVAWVQHKRPTCPRLPTLKNINHPKRRIASDRRLYTNMAFTITNISKPPSEPTTEDIDLPQGVGTKGTGLIPLEFPII